MKNRLTRLSKASDERRVILILTCIAVVFAVFSCLFTNRAEAAVVLSDNPKNLIRTSHNDEYYSIFQTNGSRITAVGRYASDRLRKIYVYNFDDDTGLYKISVKGDGSYEAELDVKPPKACRTSLVLKFDSGATLSYTIEYNNGKWGFPDNGLSEKSASVFDKIYDMPPQVAAAYLSASGDPAEIASAQEQLRLIAEEHTKGLTSDYDKARALARYVAENYYYDHDAADSDKITEETVALASVLKSCRTICSGFANLYCALLEAVGIDAVNIKGSVTSDEVKYDDLKTSVQNHEWSAFYYEAEKRWVWVDCCWNGSGDYRGGEYIEKIPHERYFDIEGLTLSFNHRADKAERRKYFAAEVNGGTGTTTTPKEEAPESEDTTSGSTEQTTKPPAGTEDKENTEKDDNNKDNNTGNAEDNTVLYIILGVLIVGIAALIAVIFRLSRNGRNN